MKTSLALPALLCALAALPAQASDVNPGDLPSVGEIAPAFALRPFQAGAAAVEGDEGRTAVELDSVCGIRSPASTAAVLVVFIDKDGMNDLTVANGWHRRYKKDGLHVIAISEEPRPEAFGTEVVRARLGFPVLDDRHHVVATRYGVDKAPFSLLLDRDCRVLGLNNRSIATEQNALGAAIGQLVDGAKAERKRLRKQSR